MNHGNKMLCSQSLCLVGLDYMNPGLSRELCEILRDELRRESKLNDVVTSRKFCFKSKKDSLFLYIIYRTAS